jgi:PKD repeat protein
MWFSTSQNPIKIFTAGNWSIKLNASNSYGSNITAGTYFVNVSQEIPITPQEYPKVVLMFDDGYTSTITNAYPILAAYNYNATAYVVTDWITSGVAGNMSVSNLTTLYNSGWDIGNHGSQHFDMQVCTTAQDQALIQQGQTNITNWGFTRAAYHLAYPYGAYDSDAMTAAANVGTLTARTVNSANITFPVASLYDLPITIECDDTVPVIEVTNAIANNNLVNRSVFILFHYVDNTAGTYHWTPEHLTELIEYIHTNGYQPITISQWYTLNSGGATTPVASFTINKNSVRIPNSITATDTSTNTPTSWQWSWGDGTVNSTTQNPTHTYTKRGKFTINMAATNTGGTDAADASSVRVVGYENYY